MGKVHLSSKELAEARKKAVSGACLPKNIRDSYNVSINDNKVALSKKSDKKG